MRICLRCGKFGKRVEVCTRDDKPCPIVNRGWKVVPPHDVLDPARTEGAIMNLPDTFRFDGDAAGDANIEVLTGDGHDPEYIAAGGMPEAEKPGWTPLAAEPVGTVAGSILREAAAIVDGARNQSHGDKERSFAAIAAMWTAYLGARKNPTGPVRAHDAAHMMVLMKQQRAEWGSPIRDHFTDGAGYSAIAGELALSSKET